VASETLDLQAEPAGVAAWTAATQSAVETEVAWGQRFLDRIAEGGVEAESVLFELQALRIGNSLGAIFMAAEMSVEYGLRVRREHANRFELVWPAAYANAIVGYVPARRQLAVGGYEVDGNNHILLLPGRYAEDTESRIHAAIARLLAD
jgi:hypothetical protein